MFNRLLAGRSNQPVTWANEKHSSLQVSHSKINRMVGLEWPTGLPKQNGGKPKLTVTLEANADARLFAVPAQYAYGNGGNDAAAVVSASKRQIMNKQHTFAMFHSLLKPGGRWRVMKPGDWYWG